MPTWIDDLKRQVKELTLDVQIEPPTEISAEEHVVGEMDEDLKRLYQVIMHLRKSSAIMMQEAFVLGFQTNVDGLVGAGAELTDKFGVAQSIFIISLRDTFNLWDKPYVGIRKGWKVVWRDQEPEAETEIKPPKRRW